MAQHSHKYNIGADDVVRALVDKLRAAVHVNCVAKNCSVRSTMRRGTIRIPVRRSVFFHGLLTGYAVAPKLL
jgi:hypothetical protein